ncbi:MAG: hypothetical protein Q9207_007474 [Kuettlingeria erythrocarpa]
MSTSDSVSRIYPGTFIDEAEGRRILQEVGDEYEKLTGVAIRNGFRILRPGSPEARELVEEGDVLPDSEADSDEASSQSEAMHWTESISAQPPAQQNQAGSLLHSQLLSLPAEILELILGYVLGNQVIHVDEARAIGHVHARHCPNPPGCVIDHGPQFYLRTCSAPISEADALRQFHTQASSIPVDDNARWYVADACARHETCRPWERPGFACNDPASASPWRNQFSILRVCRELAARAFRIFWESNTFSFGESASFGRFLPSLSVMQLQRIRTIHLCLDAEGLVIAGDFDPSEIRKLVSLDHLHVSVQSLNVGFVGDMDSNTPSIRQVDLRHGQAADFLRLEVLDIQRVSVIVYDNQEDYEEDHSGQTLGSRFQLRFTLDHKRGLARMIENTLLFDKTTRDVLAAKDRQIFELEHLLKAMKRSLYVRYQVQRKEI